MPAKQAPAAAAKPANKLDEETALEIGGGALALLALGGAAFAMSRRRRRREEEEWHEEPAAEHDHVEPAAVAAAQPIEAEPMAETQPAVVAPAASAFAWNRPDEPTGQRSDDGSDRRPGETWVERAYRGPSPANPSVSLKNRLRRAAFFDKREREVAEGKAAPVEADAGLPDAIGQPERELA